MRGQLHGLLTLLAVIALTQEVILLITSYVILLYIACSLYAHKKAFKAHFLLRRFNRLGIKYHRVLLLRSSGNMFTLDGHCFWTLRHHFQYLRDWRIVTGYPPILC
jgi:hypothetical protein